MLFGVLCGCVFLIGCVCGPVRFPAPFSSYGKGPMKVCKIMQVRLLDLSVPQLVLVLVVFHFL